MINYGDDVLRNIKLTIEYDGSRYRGWQRLNDSENTIQGKIESVLRIMTQEKIELIGSGRTDAGAHAFNQVASFKTNSDMKIQSIKSYCNQYLPEDIVIKAVEEEDEKFHARYNATSKKYMYRIWRSESPTPFHRKYTYHMARKLDMKAMKKATSFLIGEHDFQAFSSVKSKKKSTLRKIFSIEIIEKGEELKIIFHGNGFLHNMVRILVGTIIEIGEGKRLPESIPEILVSKDRAMAGETSPAQGLFLADVYYD